MLLIKQLDNSTAEKKESAVEPKKVTEVKCLEDYCNNQVKHEHSSIMQKHLTALGEGEGIDYKMIFHEDDTNENHKKHMDGTHSHEEKDANGVVSVCWKKHDKIISPWHDIPHMPDEASVSFVCEIPKFDSAKMECITTLPHNPIMQDKNADGTPRFYHGPIFWNYGYVPQTWEDPSHIHPQLHYKGDADPLDVVEIGATKLKVGSVNRVKPLGTLAMIDGGEVDYKVICISYNDPLAIVLNDIADLEVHCKGTISGIREWFRWYKTPANKGKNEFGYNEEVQDAKKTWEIIAETHNSWKQLVRGEIGDNKFWTPLSAAKEAKL